MAVPPLAATSSVVVLNTSQPLTGGSGPNVSPTEIAQPTLPPLLMSPIETAPPLAEAEATPPLPAEASRGLARHSIPNSISKSISNK